MTKIHSELIRLLTQITDPKLMRLFLTDLLSPVEFTELATRWQIIKLLHAGMPQREIAEKLGVGIATVTRGSRALAQNNSGFAKILNKLYETK